MSIIGKCYCGACRCCSWLQSPFLLLIRVFWGILFFQAGVNKFANIETPISLFEKLGIIWPVFNAYLVATVETVGGILLIVGFLSRIAAIPLSIVMIVALFTAHQSATFNLFGNTLQFLQQGPVTYLYTCLVILCFGPGFFSADELWKSHK